MVSQLLPPNSTPLERALASVLPRQSLDALADAPAWHEGNAPESYLPWLAAEYGLADFVGYFPGVRELLAAGKPWLRLRGTAAAVKLALSWIGMQGRVEQDGSLLQIDPGSPAAPTNLAAIRQLVGASAPAHVELYRLYHGYDRRVLHLSGTHGLGDGLLSDDSGIWIDGIKLSFGTRQAAGVTATAELPATAARTDTHHSALYNDDRFRLSVSVLGSPAPALNYPFALGQLITLTAAQGAASQPLAARYSLARAALALSDDPDALGDINCGFAGSIELEYAPFTLSGSGLSAHDNQRRRIALDERFVLVIGLAAPAAISPEGIAHAGQQDTRASQATRPETEQAAHQHTTTHGSAATRRPANRWSGRWDRRTWRTPDHYLSLTQEGA